MNDVLKSLTIQEAGGGKISGVRYDSDIPLSEKLNDFPFKLGDGVPLSAVLSLLKGSRLEVQFGSEKVSGVIVAARLIAGDKEPPEFAHNAQRGTDALKRSKHQLYTVPHLFVRIENYATDSIISKSDRQVQLQLSAFGFIECSAA
jgi:hypothetical protein